MIHQILPIVSILLYICAGFIVSKIAIWTLNKE